MGNADRVAALNRAKNQRVLLLKQQCRSNASNTDTCLIGQVGTRLLVSEQCYFE